MNASPGKSLGSVSIPKATVGPSRRNEQSPRQQPRVGGRGSGSGSGMLSPSFQGAKLSSRCVHRHNDTVSRISFPLFGTLFPRYECAYSYKTITLIYD